MDEEPRRYRNVMLPLDGSPTSESAVPLAATIAQRAEATLHVVRVTGPSERSVGSEEYLTQVVARIEAEYGSRAVATAREGKVVDSLVDEAARCDADVTVMATHGRSGLSRLWLGSVATGVLSATDRPLMLFRPDGGAATGAAPQRFTKILMPLDGSAPSEECLPHAVALGELFDATYHLTRVVRVPDEVPTAYFDEERASALDYLEDHAERMRAEQRTVSTSVRLEQQPARGILAVCATEDCDAIVMATRGREGLGRVLLGSTADKVLRGAEVPMLLFGPRTIKS